MTTRSYPAAALYGFDLDAELESYERAEDSAREREELEAEAEAGPDFTHACPLRGLLE